MNQKQLPSQSCLKLLFDYNPSTGVLVRRIPPSNASKRYVGKDCTRVSNGRKIVTINRSNYFVHRIIWKWMTGKDPVGVIDHRDRNTSNHRWCNLFDVTSSHNSLNRGHRNKYGFKGVGYDRIKNRYQGQVRINTRGVTRTYRTRWVPTPEEAHRELEDYRSSLRFWYQIPVFG